MSRRIDSVCLLCNSLFAYHVIPSSHRGIVYIVPCMRFRIGLNDLDWEMGCSSLPLPHIDEIRTPSQIYTPPLCSPPTPECNHDVEPPGGPGWVWSDGSLVDFSAWAMGEPNSWWNGQRNCVDGVGPGDCVAPWRNGVDWNDGDSCTEQKSYICGFECDSNDAEYHVSRPSHDHVADIQYCHYDSATRTW